MSITRRGFGKFLGAGLLGVVAAPVMAKLSIPVKPKDEVFPDYVSALSRVNADFDGDIERDYECIYNDPRKIRWDEIVGRPIPFPPSRHITSLG